MVSLYSTIKMMHGPINIRFIELFNYWLLSLLCHVNSQIAIDISKNHSTFKQFKKT